MTNPPDAVSGAATPAQQCNEVCKCGHDKTDHASRASVCLRCSLCIQFEPAATPEAQIPECVHVPKIPWVERHAQIEVEYHEWEAGQRAAGKLWREIGPYTEWVYRRLDMAESQLAALRVERDQAWNEAIEAAAIAVKAMPACPFDGPNNLLPTDPCSVCGDRGDDVNAVSHCRSPLIAIRLLARPIPGREDRPLLNRKYWI